MNLNMTDFATMNMKNSNTDRRLSTVERRSTNQKPKADVGNEQNGLIFAGPIMIDDRCKLVYIEGKQKRLTPKEYALLRLLADDIGKVVSNAEIIATLWPGNTGATASDVKQYMFLLRKKIEQDPHHPTFIMNAKGFGYYLKV